MNASVLSVSVVVYKSELMTLLPLFDSLAQIPQAMVCVVDNASDAKLRDEVVMRGWQYLDPGRNLGYGKGHNAGFAFLRAAARPYHLVVNPDVSFTAADIERMLAFMQVHEDIGQLMPRVLYPDGSQQHLCKLLPTPMDLIVRRFLPEGAWKRRARDRYELRNWSYDSIADIPVLSGCFMLLRADAFERKRGFDPRYFMYLEDTDLSRRIGMIWRTVFFPDAVITHHYAKGSYASAKLLRYHVISAVRYFCRWGWVRDPYRRYRNKQAEIDLGL